MEIVWSEPHKSTDGGAFPPFQEGDIAKRFNHGDKVFKKDHATRKHVDLLREKGFEIITERSEMAPGKACLLEYTVPSDPAVVGTLYAYKHDLEEKLGAESPRPARARSVAGGKSPQSLTSGADKG